MKYTVEPTVYYMGNVHRKNTQPALESSVYFCAWHSGEKCTKVLFRIQGEMSTWHSGSERRDLGSPVGHAWDYFHQVPTMMSPYIRD